MYQKLPIPLQSSKLCYHLISIFLCFGPQSTVFDVFVFLSWFDYFLCYGPLLTWMMLFGPLSTNFLSKILEISLKNPQKFPWKSLKIAWKILEICLENLGNLPPNFWNFVFENQDLSNIILIKNPQKFVFAFFKFWLF